MEQVEILSEKLINKKSPQEIDLLIKTSIRVCLEHNPKYHKSDTLIITTYNVLCCFYIEKKKYALLSAPTGSGKSIIGQLIHFCCSYIDFVLNDESFLDDEKIKLRKSNGHTYFLTSSKILQEQLENDFEIFNLFDYFTMLKGTSNYECTMMTKITKEYTTYEDRFCLGMKTEERNNLDCYKDCPYINQRYYASNASCTVLNYSYFLNVMKLKFKPYFGIRPLTICDEAHLLPSIVLDNSNIVLTMFNFHKANKIYENMLLHFKNLITNNGSISLNALEIETSLDAIVEIFSKEKIILNDVVQYLFAYKKIIIKFVELVTTFNNNAVFRVMFSKDVFKLRDNLLTEDFSEYIDSLSKRPEDLFIEVEMVSNFIYKHKRHVINRFMIYDLNESAICKKNFLTKIDKGLFMSATLGNIDEFAVLMGIEQKDYSGFRLQSNFDFSKSPIYLTNSGYLNYSSFNKNIGKVLEDVIYIATKLHPNEKGIIHTGTYQISKLLSDLIYATKMKKDLNFDMFRFLIYENSEEKQTYIDKINNQPGNFIIVGPSLYEGIDLKYDKGRFNILVKAPYSGLSEYTKKKIKRFPFLYERNTLEKVVQAIGRTNRCVDDQSTTYLLDGLLNNLIFKTQSFITERIKYKKL